MFREAAHTGAASLFFAVFQPYGHPRQCKLFYPDGTSYLAFFWKNCYTDFISIIRRM
jgi:hypothetical protein